MSGKKINTFLKKLFNLKEGAVDRETMIENIKDDSDFSSARIWTLVFAIGVASVGLNINSIPLVIGAMLISPLMGPIVSMGMALAINDGGLMRRSLRNFAILAVISIVISTIYFALSPITNAQSELLSRIQPTIFDVLVAIFGGIAGFIGISRARQNNVIPGVAIATALMPPLCTVGYGIGTLQPVFIFGALYLFLINSIFICLSSLLVAKYLKLPKVEYPDQEHQKKTRRIIAFVILVIVTPAIYFAYTFVGQNNFQINAERFVQHTFEDSGYLVIHKDFIFKTSPKVIELAFLSTRFTKAELDSFEATLPDFGLKNTKLQIRQSDFALTEKEWQELLLSIQGDDEKITTLEKRLESNNFAGQNSAQILEEVKVINEAVIDLALGPLAYGQSSEDEDVDRLVAIFYTDTNRAPLDEAAARKITNWLKVRLNNETVIIYFIPPVPTEEEEWSVDLDLKPTNRELQIL